MPRYFFHRTDEAFDADDEGTELPDSDAARLEAIVYAAETVRDHPHQVWSGAPFRVEVSDEAGMPPSTVIMLEIEIVTARAVKEAFQPWPPKPSAPRRLSGSSGPSRSLRSKTAKPKWLFWQVASSQR